MALGLARSLAPSLRGGAARAGGGLLVSISRQDGAFGQALRAPLASLDNPLSGALAGLVKSAAHEWPEVRCRALDVTSSWSAEAAARAVVTELGQAGPREVGLGPAGRTTLALHEAAALPLASRFDAGAVVLVTGGARGVTASCARALAERTGVSLVLLGRSPEPAEEPAWLAAAVTEADIKRACLDHAEGERPTPRALGDACAAILAGREIRATLTSLASLAGRGARAVYRSVDVRDAAAVRRVTDEVRASLGPIQGLVHGAGVVRDRRIEDKRDDDFDQVLDPKLQGLRALLDATRHDDLRSLVLFASATGRFGRRGQADYAVANQALVSVARHESARRPRCRVVALDWGPWQGGMVSPALQREFEREGVPLIALESGAAAMVDEALTAPGGPVEVVLGAGFGSEDAAEWILAGSMTLDPSSSAILRDHVLAGKSVLPLAFTLDAFASAATAVAGEPLAALEDVRVFRGVTVGAEPVDVTVWARVAEASVDLSGRRGWTLELRSGLSQGHPVVHVRATALVGAPAAPPTPLPADPSLRPFRTPVDRLYADQLFHGPSLEVIESVEGMTGDAMDLTLSPRPSPQRIDPVALDGVFQALIVWCRANVGAPSLPSRIARLSTWGLPDGGRAHARVRVRAIEGMVVSSDVDVVSEDGRLVLRLEGYICTASPSLERAFGGDVAGATPPAHA